MKLQSSCSQRRPRSLALGVNFEDVVQFRAEQGDFGDVDVDARVRDAVKSVPRPAALDPD